MGLQSRVCTDCHADVLTEFAFNERHRVGEGALECTSCHDPHAASSRSLLGGFKQQQCLACHTDKGGPFVFEHPASRGEGCTACHSSHGSPNRHMLAHQRVGELCFTCHAATPQFHSGFAPAGPPRFGLDTQCTTCHSTLHGSNFDPFFLR
jgi:DmsE family decaheme c-type cytochrome